jgi:hypothetical protein
MKIKNVNGTFWNADTNCFGPECVATEYATIDDCPSLIEDNNFTEIKLYDHRYYTRYDDDAVASVVQ